ncbi:MAG: type I polyketide synthase, partial [Bacteroidota bacterium]
MAKYTGLEIAVIGLSGRFPEADSVQEFWENLLNAKDCISTFTTEEAREEGELEANLRHPNYVRSNAFMESKKYFDSEFFNYRPDEAELMDPQLRVYLQCCWEALEDSGYSKEAFQQKVGHFTSGTPNVSWNLHAILKNRAEGLVDDFTAYQLREVTFLGSRISYDFNLQGPAVFIQSACSSSLVAIHEACNSLLLGECSMALAGGVSINNHSRKGYIYQNGMINSQDGKCRPFDQDASGTVIGDGAGVVVLKRLKDALRDRDHIYAIVKGTGVNNDGNNKVGYSAPSVQGQRKAIEKAISMARIKRESISYIEAHGTGTKLGDPIEVEALNRVFGKERPNSCAMGSVKSNIGHLDTAAGVAGFIKTVLSLKHRQIPPSLHFKQANPEVNFDRGPLYVNAELKKWERNGTPLRAGVSSFGIGGTNAHVILEEAPEIKSSASEKKYKLLPIAAKTEEALNRNTTQLTDFLASNPNYKMADLAYTLQTGRVRFPHRRIVLCEGREDALRSFAASEWIGQTEATLREESQNIVFMFSGQGSQYIHMGRDLYNSEKSFRETVNECLQIAGKYTREDLLGILFPKESTTDDKDQKINHTEYAQPLLFTIEYALAKLLMAWGVQPNYLIGHSLGEYVAACISGVFTLEDALRLVVKRGQLMGSAERGSMLSIKISEEELKPFLEATDGIDLAVINSVSSL